MAFIKRKKTQQTLTSPNQMVQRKTYVFRLLCSLRKEKGNNFEKFLNGKQPSKKTAVDSIGPHTHTHAHTIQKNRKRKMTNEKGNIMKKQGKLENWKKYTWRNKRKRNIGKQTTFKKSKMADGKIGQVETSRN